MEDEFVSSSISDFKTESDSEEDSVSSLSEGNLDDFQEKQNQQNNIQGIVELDDSDSFTTEDSSSDETISEKSSYKAINCSPSILSFLIVTNARNKHYVEEISSLKMDDESNNTISTQIEIKRRRSRLNSKRSCSKKYIHSFNSKLPNNRRSHSLAFKVKKQEILGVPSKKTCHCCKK